MSSMEYVLNQMKSKEVHLMFGNSSYFLQLSRLQTSCTSLTPEFSLRVFFCSPTAEVEDNSD